METMDIILKHVLVFDDDEFKRYLQKEWFSCKKMWWACYRQQYHKNVDTTHISEGWNNMLKRKLDKAGVNKLVSTVFTTCVEDLLFDEEHRTKLMAYKQSNLWRNLNIAK